MPPKHSGKPTAETNSQKSNRRLLAVISYLLASIAAAMFAYSTFFSHVSELQVQGIYWFGIAALCALLPTFLPSVTRVKFADFELEFKEKLEEIERRIVEVEDAFVKSFEELRQAEEQLPPSVIEQRNRMWDRWDEDFQSLPESQRFAAQRDNSLVYLKKFGLTVGGLKQRLARLGFYDGTINDTFTPELAKALEDFQRHNNMRHVDGMFGELTFEKIVQRLDEMVQRDPSSAPNR